MASGGVGRIKRCLSSFLLGLARESKVDPCAFSRRVPILSSRNVSIPAARVLDKHSVKDDRINAKFPIVSEFENRNPRNPEYFGYNKPRGGATQKYRQDYYNKLKFIISNRHSRGEVVHNSGVVLASASTVDFEITRHLYKTTDISAARNLGRVLAQRCIEAGITRVYWEPKYGDRTKLRVKAFASAISKGGTVLLNEPKRIVHPETFYCDYTPKKRRRKWLRLPASKRKKEHLRRTK
ncbi:39S ribosomal protein L18, mitochondrial-like isoform X1 [Acropora millepora]|uniref:39S ribosomal protein L18, mitochondrial-like isoform X1 n=1 Tax=Acropora millepora TaxID=45264 RepID=UPI0010FCD746|nr:39S ribosomal protein L18, mitochondrial-like isoform X1 [Acropora millepora]